MKKLSAVALLLALALLFAPAPTTVSGLASDANANAGAIGSTIADFKLPDAWGKEHSLSSLEGKHGTVLIFVSTNCPVSNAYNPRMEKLAQDLKAKGVNVVGINSNVAETQDAIAAHSKENNLTFAILKDKNNKIADALGARVTPEAYFLDASNKLVYRGRVDDKDPRRGDATVSELRDAVEATVSGKPVAKAEALAFGCSIKRG